MMIKSINSITAASTQKKYTFHLLLLILLLSFVLMGSNSGVEAESGQLSKAEYNAHPIAYLLENDSILGLLGRDFIEITKLLGVPDEKGYSEAFGPHQYILYKHDKGFIRFSSPESMGNKNIIVNSVILGPGREVLGATVGMHFQEIINVVGTPDFGPETGMDDLYYMNYYHGEINNQLPEVFVSFVSISIDAPTEYEFIKLEHSKLDEILLQVGAVN
ncbi:hypothetical protein [Gudongella sp. DL1XJH-153]|uniref:hypothetical protein n=1 Tax=Gudongella sp. DL1XJH-153 TaxID=3409804 RepID=UPI003BB58F78